MTDELALKMQTLKILSTICKNKFIMTNMLFVNQQTLFCFVLFCFFNQMQID